MNKSDLYWQVYLNLENEVLTLSKYVEFADNQTVVDKKNRANKNCFDRQSVVNIFVSHS